MEWNKFVAALAAMPLFDKWAWGAVFVAILAAIGLLLRWEQRSFRQRGKGDSWLTLRLCALPLLALVVAVVLIPSQAISGMEALAYFYLALLTLAPLIWFGGHLLAGRLVRPRFSRGESLFLAASGLFLMLIPLIGLTLAQGPIFTAARSVREASFRSADVKPLAHAIRPLQRFELPGVGVILAQSLIAPPGIELERIDQRLGNDWYDTRDSTHYTFCRNGQDIHLLWSARETAPELRLYWRDAGVNRLQANFVADSTASATTEYFNVGFRSDGIDPPVPIPRFRASIAYYIGGGDRLYFNSLNSLQPGENFANDCILRGYKRVAADKEGPPQVLALMFYPPNGRPPLRAEIRRPPAVSE